MEIEKVKGIIEAILFATGRKVEIKELVSALEMEQQDLINIIEQMKLEYAEQERGFEIVKVDSGYQLCSNKEYYEYVYPIIDKRAKPNLSQAALETLSIIAYNSGITRAQIESIRGVSADATIYKLLEYNLITDAGKLDAPGRPTTYKVTEHFMKMFGYSSLEELPELPRYKMDENQQIVIDDLVNQTEAPLPEREEGEKEQENRKSDELEAVQEEEKE